MDETSFFEIDYWGKGAEAINKYLTKGQQVAIEGELRQDRWDQDGQARSKVVINASNVRLLGSASGGQGNGSYQRGSQTSYDGAQEPKANVDNGNVPSFDDDIPF